MEEQKTVLTIKETAKEFNFPEYAIRTLVKRGAFPVIQAGIRFIAINDGVDSTNGASDDFTPFRNIINEWYCRDISKKIKAGMQSRAKSGEQLTGTPPYGYKKSEANPKQWVIDEVPAKIIREIYQLYEDNDGFLLSLCSIFIISYACYIFCIIFAIFLWITRVITPVCRLDCHGKSSVRNAFTQEYMNVICHASHADSFKPIVHYPAFFKYKRKHLPEGATSFSRKNQWGRQLAATHIP